MNYIVSLFLLLFASTSIAQRDPFYGESHVDSFEAQADNNLQKNAKHLASLQDCLTNDFPKISLISPFEQLKLIGLVEIDGEFRALFLDPQQRIIDIKQGEVIEQDFIQIYKISLKSVTYIDWQKSQSCTNPTYIQLKL